MENCIFCKIVKGEIPSNIVYEDDTVMSFITSSPDNMGHSLVIPKNHYVNVYETPEDVLENLIKVVKKISIAIKKSMKADGINIIMNNDSAAGQVIFHSHIHVIPRLAEDGFQHWHGKRGYMEGEKEEISEKIIQAL